MDPSPLVLISNLYLDGPSGLWWTGFEDVFREDGKSLSVSRDPYLQDVGGGLGKDVV